MSYVVFVCLHAMPACRVVAYTAARRYTEEEKVKIAQRYLLPKSREASGPRPAWADVAESWADVAW